MAFNLRALENHSGSGSGRKVFTYDSGTDNQAAVKGANYFNDAATLLTVGDRIHVHASDADFDAHVSAISAAGAVTIAAVDAFA
jgi:hypothetical protein